MRDSHDLGGLPAGQVDREEHETTFFEKRVDAVMRLLSHPSRRMLRVDENRRAIESLPDYADLGYYERWINSLRILLVEKGVLSEEEIRARIDEIRARKASAET
jgi:hypothetical protein